MKSKRLGTKLKRVLAALLTTALLVSDHTILYAADAGTVQTDMAMDAEQSISQEIVGTVSAGDVDVEEDTSAGKGENPSDTEEDIPEINAPEVNTPDVEDNLDISEELAGTVSGEMQ